MPALGDKFWVHGVALVDDNHLWEELNEALLPGHELSQYGSVEFMQGLQGPHAIEVKATTNKNGKWFNCRFITDYVVSPITGAVDLGVFSQWELSSCVEQAGGGQGPDVDIPGGIMVDLPYQESRRPRVRRIKATKPGRKKRSRIAAGSHCYTGPQGQICVDIDTALREVDASLADRGGLRYPLDAGEIDAVIVHIGHDDPSLRAAIVSRAATLARSQGGSQ